MHSVSIKTLRDRLAYDPQSGNLTWKCRPVVGRHERTFNSNFAGKVAGTSKDGGRRGVHIRIERKSFHIREHRIAWAIYYGVWPSGLIDHIDGNPANNKITNLRLATSSQNAMNRPCRIDSGSGIKGVHKRKNRWRAQIKINQRIRHLGSFMTKEEAAKAYADAAKEAFGKYARTA